MISVGLVGLGCAKNQVDGEMLMASLKNDGFVLKDDAALADIAIVNTCCFIESAKRESIEEILELARIKQEGRIKKIVVTGCMAERYKEEIHKELPEVDAVVGIGGNANIASILRDMVNTGEYTESFPDKILMPLFGERELTTPSYFAYIKIAEGCNNRCTYCAIPSIRGKFRSRTMENIEQEARRLVENGAKEIILIAQDTTRYGQDIYGEYSLAKLMERLCKIDGLRWLRTLYCYPEAITDELLDVIAREDKIVKYIDLPLQHASGRLLKTMNRVGNYESLTALMEKIRSKIPGVTLRTTFITGFPGETEEDFEELSQFVKETRFDRMGCFPYSREEGTAAAAMPNQIDEEVKLRRAEILMQNQMDILQETGEDYIGTELDVMVEAFDRYAECWFGRSYRDAPDVDGKVFFSVGENPPMLGEFVRVAIEDCIDGDLFGSIIEN